jgi:hypothetical protein
VHKLSAIMVGVIETAAEQARDAAAARNVRMPGSVA